MKNLKINILQLSVFISVFIVIVVRVSFGQSTSTRFEIRQGGFFSGGGNATSESVTATTGFSHINSEPATNANTTFGIVFKPLTTQVQPLFMEPFHEIQHPNEWGHILNCDYC